MLNSARIALLNGCRRGSITYYNGLYDKDQLKHKPQVKTTRRGQQVRICSENECDCDGWEHRDMSHIKHHYWTVTKLMPH